MRICAEMVKILGLAGITMCVSSTHVEAQPREYLFGCGMIWGEWLGLTGETAREWDRRSFDKIVQMGGTNCPANFVWGSIEKVRGVYDWDYVDHQVAEATARGLEIFAYSGLTPDWALPPGILDQYGSGIGYRFPPDEQYIPEFEAFFEALAARYAGQVTYYEFWNEPNGCSWINDGCSNGHMAYTYVPWLIRWYEAMKRGDPGCVLAVGGLDYNSGVTQGYRYIEDIYTHGGGDHFDAVAIHPYGEPLHWQAIPDTYQVLVNHGDGHKKLWLNEYGWDTSDENHKAGNLTTVLNALKDPQYHYVFQANYLVITDLPGTPDWGHDYGLCTRNVSTLTITPRQSWYAFQAVDKTFPNTVHFTADKLTGPAPLTVQFTDLSTIVDPTGWFWEFGDGATSTQQHPSHTYTVDGDYTVRLTVSNISGSQIGEKADYIRVDSTPPPPGVDNPSFEENGGSHSGWQIVHVSGEGPDNPLWSNATNPWGIHTPAGSYFAGKVTSGLSMNFYFGQVVGVTGFHPQSAGADWQLSALYQLHATVEGNPIPGGIHQRWEIGWNDDGSVPSGIMDCDRYVTVADLSGHDTGNSQQSFFPLNESGAINGVTGLRAVAVRARLFNDAPWWWSYSNIDDVDLVVTAIAPSGYDVDFDNDLDVDQDDMIALRACMTGPGITVSNPNCLSADADGDDDLDMVDFGQAQLCLSGPSIEADPACRGG